MAVFGIEIGLTTDEDTVRVIAGSAKGRRLVAPKGLTTRPPLDQIKEALFNILGDRAVGAGVLDLYAGSGSLGIEALSRGATSAVFADSSLAAVRVIRKNLAKTGFTSQASVICGRALSAVKKLAQEGASFNLIFLDPPFKISLIELRRVFEALRAGSLLKEDALIILRLFFKRELSEEPGFSVESTRVYGDSRLVIYKKEER